MNQKLFGILFPLTFLGCSSFVEEPKGLQLQCATVEDTCPTDAEVHSIVQKFQTYRSFDDTETLYITWYDKTHIIRQVGDYKIYGQTEDGYHTEVGDIKFFVHELFHVMYFRTTGDGDENHEIEPGPWTDQDNVDIETIKHEVGG